MNFERWLLTEQFEIYRFSENTETRAYLLFQDTFSQTDVTFGEEIFDFEFEPNDNWIKVDCATLVKLSDKEKEQILSICESLLAYKTSIDYRVNFFEIAEDLTFDYPNLSGFKQMVGYFDDIFKVCIKISDYLSFNNIMQK